MKKRITENAVRRLRPGRSIMCNSLTGFGVRKSPKTHRVVFFIRRVIDGKDYRVRLGTHQQMTVREARKLAVARIWELESETAKSPELSPAPFLQASGGADPRLDEVLSLLRGEGEPEPEPVMTLGQLWAELGPGWLAGVKVGTQKNLTALFRSRILPRWGDTPIDQIETKDLIKWYQGFLDTAPHYGASAVRNIIRLLRIGQEQGYIETLPAFKIKFQASKPRQPMEHDAVVKMVTALEAILEEDPTNPYANAVIAIMNTGERARSGASLHTSEVNYKDMVITKSRKFSIIKKIPMSNYTASFLRSIHPQDGGYYFPNRKDPSIPIKYATLRNFLISVVDKHGIRSVDGSIPTLHSIRHTYATLLEEQGLPISHIQRLLGHTSMQSTLRYIHGNVNAVREGANKLEVTRVRVKGKSHRKKVAKKKASSR